MQPLFDRKRPENKRDMPKNEPPAGFYIYRQESCQRASFQYWRLVCHNRWNSGLPELYTSDWNAVVVMFLSKEWKIWPWILIFVVRPKIQFAPTVLNSTVKAQRRNNKSTTWPTPRQMSPINIGILSYVVAQSVDWFASDCQVKGSHFREPGSPLLLDFSWHKIT